MKKTSEGDTERGCVCSTCTVWFSCQVMWSGRRVLNAPSSRSPESLMPDYCGISDLST